MRYEISLIIRTALALALFIIPTMLGANVFQKIFEPLTFDVVYFFLERSGVEPKSGSFSVSYAISILGGEATINVVKYCVTASAYYLLALFCIITMDVALWKRVFIFLMGSVLIFGMNIVRILILISTLLNDKGAYQSTHSVLNFLLSVVYVVVVWALLSPLFKIKTIPFFSDIKFLIQEVFKR